MPSLSYEPLKRLWRSRRGNVTFIFAVSAPIIMFAVGAAIDFTNASVVRSKLNAAADAAALAALTPAMLQAPDSVAVGAATEMFMARAGAIGSLKTPIAGPIIPPPTHPNGANSRSITVSYAETTNTFFGTTLKLVTGLGISGTATAIASIPPNIDFYLLLDNSPSMSLPSTQSGLNTMQNLTLKEASGGCAFACHQASTNNGDTAGNPCSDGSMPTQSGGSYCASKNSKNQPITQIVNYQLARNNGITLRLDEVSTGVTTLMNTAWQSQTSSQFTIPPSYRFAVYQMDTLWSVPNANQQLMQLTGDYQNGWSSASGNFGVMEMYSNGIGCANAACTSGVSNNDQATNFDTAMSSINATMPTPGYGTNAAGDSPQEVLFFVTDGVEDESNVIRLIQPINGSSAGPNYCTMIKNRGIKIAILYTEYLPVPVNSFYQQNVAPFQNNIGPSLQACASPNLYYDAAIGSNLGNALQTLFSTVVQSAQLSN